MMKWLEVFIPPGDGRMLVHRRVTPCMKFAGREKHCESTALLKNRTLTPYSKITAYLLFFCLCMLISPLCLVHIQGGVEIFLIASCTWNRDKLQPDGPLASYADLVFLFYFINQRNYNMYRMKIPNTSIIWCQTTL